jgi:hypothetical protein
MSFWDDDIDEFFDDFKETDSDGDSVILYPDETGETPIEAIFDEAQELYDSQAGEFINVKPQITCKTINVSSVQADDNIKVNTTTYKAKNFMDDGTGITIITLSES